MKKRYIKKLLDIKWNIGFITLDNFKDKGVKDINYLKHNYKDRWFADPFILGFDEEYIHVLAEEFFDPIQRGRISYLKVRKNDYTLLETKPILELEKHLSFPFIWRENSEIYVLPECFQSGCWSVYKYNKNIISLDYIKDVIKKPLTDATIFQYNNDYFLLSTMQPDPNGKKLTIFKSTDKFDGYKLSQELFFDENIARNAGTVFLHNNKLYRPAQDCTKRYGHGVIIQEMCISGDKIDMLNNTRIYPTTFRYKLGIHTFNEYNGLVVMDFRGYRHPIVGTLLGLLKNILIKK